MNTESILKLLLSSNTINSPVTFAEIFIRVTAATTLGFIISFIGFLTYTGKNFDKSIIHSQIILTIIFSIMINVIGQNIAWALGIFGTLSIIQFRTSLKDAKDTATFFYSIIIGISCGAGYFSLAIIGFTVMTIVLITLKFLPFPEAKTSFIKFYLVNFDSIEILKNALIQERIKFQLVSISDKNLSVTYQIRLDIENAFQIASKMKTQNSEFINSFSIQNELD